MRLGFLLVIGFALALVPGCARAAAPLDEQVEACRAWIEKRPWAKHEAPETRILSSQVACYDGMIAHGSLDTLIEWARTKETSNGARPVLVLRSGGGDAGPALDLAEALQKRDAAIHVSGICASSCASFLYSGIARRHVSNGALILFHGGYSDRSRANALASLDEFLASPDGAMVADHDANRAALRQTFDAAEARQDALFDSIGVDPAVVQGVDAIDFARIDDRLCGGASDLPRTFVYFDAGQMARLGIAPRSGVPETQPDRVNAAIAALGRGFIACRAPEDVFEAR